MNMNKIAAEALRKYGRFVSNFPNSDFAIPNTLENLRFVEEHLPLNYQIFKNEILIPDSLFLNICADLLENKNK